MIKTKCPACGQVLRADDAAGGRQVRCQCGTMVTLPSATAKALDEALRAMESKGGERHEKPAARQVFSFSTARPEAPKKAESGKAEAAKGLVDKRLIWIGAAAVVAIVAGVTWNFLTPTAWEKEFGGQVEQAKSEGDQLAAEGKAVAALKKYQQALRLVNGQAIHGSELKRAVDETRSARDRLVEENKAAIDKARTAGGLVD